MVHLDYPKSMAGARDQFTKFTNANSMASAPSVVLTPQPSSGDATQCPGCSHNTLTLKKKKKKFIYNNLNFFICLPLKKIGTPSSPIRNTLKIFMPNKF